MKKKNTVHGTQCSARSRKFFFAHKRRIEKNTQESCEGFTLIELLLYISASAILLLGISLFLTTLLQARVKNQTIAEVEQQGIQIMEIMTQTIRNAESITSPSQGINSPSLTLGVYDVSKTPTVFSLVDGVIYVQESASSPVELVNTRVIASGLNFQNLSRIDTPGTVQIQFTLTHENPDGKNEYTYSKTFVGSATLR